MVSALNSPSDYKIYKLKRTLTRFKKNIKRLYGGRMVSNEIMVLGGT
jgi:hypothetical protein